MDGKSGEYIFEPNFNVLTFFMGQFLAMEHFVSGYGAFLCCGVCG